MHVYNVEVYTWSYSGYKEDQAGTRTKRFSLDAADFREAVKKVELIMAGIKSNPHVWEVGIDSITKVSDVEKVWPSISSEMNRSNMIGR